MPCRLHCLRNAAFLPEISRNEFLGDVSSQFPRLLGVSVSFYAQLVRPIRRHTVFEWSVDNVCRSLRALLHVVTVWCKCFWWWCVFGRRCIRNAVCVDSFHILVPLNYDCLFIGFEHAERSERWAFEFTGLRQSVAWISVHIVTLPHVSFHLLDSSVEVALVPLLRLHKSKVGRLDHIFQTFCVIVALFGCRRC